jgi:hypothetical protein
MSHLALPPGAKTGSHRALLAHGDCPLAAAPSPSEDAEERALPLFWVRSLSQAMIGALGGSGLVMLVHRPWIPREGLGLTWVLLVPGAALVAALVVLLGRATQGRLLPFLGQHRAKIGPGLWLGFALASVLGLGFLLSNELFHDGPLQSYTLRGYAVTAAAGALLVAGRSWLARLGRIPALSLRTTASLWLLLSALGLCILDAQVYPEAYRALHNVLTALSVALSVVAVLVFTRNQPTDRLHRAAALFGVGVALVAGTSIPASPSALQALVERPSLGRRLLLQARVLLDLDRDGYSPHLGGGDCDDRDPEAYPLSPHRDCLGWQAGSLPPPAPETGASVAPPEVILVLTIDAFRCGFGRSDRPELRDICPALTARLPEARANLRTHVFYPATLPNMRVMLGAYARDTLTGDDNALAEARDAGYRVEVVATHPHIYQQAAIAQAADSVDRTLAPRAMAPTGITSPALTDRLLERLDRHDGSPLLLWGHYFDPHAPYVLEEGEHLRHDEITSYAAEVRRTDAAIGRLLDRLDGGSRDVLVLITADHGEEFGEHGAKNHGHSLHRAASQVPFLALRLGPKHKQLPAEVPFSSHDVGRYLVAAALGRPFQASTFAFGHLDDDGDRQFSFTQGPWKLIHHRTHNLRELYNLDQDPDELHNLAADTATTDRLGQAAAALLPEVDRLGHTLLADRH